jgi:hypothetical protein
MAAAALAAGPAEARMSRTLLFGDDLLGGFALQQTADPAGALFERMFREFSNTPERLPRQRPRNDIDATLDAMQDAKVGFGDTRSGMKAGRRRGRAIAPRG